MTMPGAMPLDLLLRAVWAGRWRLALAVLLLYGAGATAILLWPRHYVAQLMVAPAETTGIAVSALLSPTPLLQGGLLDPRPSGNFAIYLDALRSPEAAALLARETALLEHLTTLRGAGLPGQVRRRLGLRIAADLDDAAAWLERRLAVTQGVASVTFTVEISHRDRASALEALQRLHGFAEAKVRGDLAEMARRRLAAIEARLATERDLYLRNALHELLGQQQRVALVLAADEAVAARLVSAPMVGIRPALPNRPLLLGLLGLLAPLAVALLALCAELLRAPRPAAAPARAEAGG